MKHTGEKPVSIKYVVKDFFFSKRFTKSWKKITLYSVLAIEFYVIRFWKKKKKDICIHKTVTGAPQVVPMVKIHLPLERHGFDLWVRKIPWRRAWQLTQVFLPGEPHGQRSLAQSMGLHRVRYNWSNSACMLL